MRTLAVILVFLTCGAHADIFLLRHAETVADSGRDPALSALGERRAANVAKRLTGLPIETVYTTDYARTRGTAQPIATSAGLEPTLYDPADPSQLIAKLKAARDHHVVVGHSNTVPALVHALGGEPGTDIDHSEYDRLYRLQFSGASVETSLWRSEPVMQRAKPATFRFDPERVANETLVFNMSLNGEHAGTSSWSYHRDDALIRLEEITQVPDHDTSATITAASEDDFATGQMTMQGTMFGNAAKILATWNERVVKGTSLMPRASHRPQGDIALTANWPTGAIERSTALMLAHAVPASEEPGGFRWYSSYDGDFRNIEVQKMGLETVTVPAGTFETYKLRYLGGAPSQIFYVTTAAPHRTVRIDIIARPWRYELVRVESSH